MRRPFAGASLACPAARGEERMGAVESRTFHLSGGHGYELRPADTSKLLSRAEELVSRHSDAIDWVVREFGSRSALQMASTLVYVDRSAAEENSPISAARPGKTSPQHQAAFRYSADRARGEPPKGARTCFSEALSTAGGRALASSRRPSSRRLAVGPAPTDVLRGRAGALRASIRRETGSFGERRAYPDIFVPVAGGS